MCIIYKLIKARDTLSELGELKVRDVCWLKPISVLAKTLLLRVIIYTRGVFDC